MSIIKEESLNLLDIFELIRDAGYAVGSGIRRISEDELCPLK